MVKIAPSLLAADFAALGEQVLALQKADADMLHLDVMDGHFVPNLSFGVPVIKALRAQCNLTFDVHLMVENPLLMAQWFVNAGADIITVHAEAVDDLAYAVDALHSLGVKVGVALKPATSAEVIRPIIDKLDLVLVMTVEPGFGGQKFMEDMLPKIKQIRAMIANRNIILSVDGGINDKTAPFALSAGADMLVAGTYVFKSDDWSKTIAGLKLGAVK